MSVLLFSGGRGNRTLLESISSDIVGKFPKLKVVVNGLDDGASTGAIRELFDNRMHGISDFLKVGVAMSPDAKLKSALETRLPLLQSMKEQLNFSKSLHDFLFLSNNFYIFDDIGISDSIKNDLKGHILNFLEYIYQQNKIVVNISDFKIGNIVFASMYINANLDFNSALLVFLKFCRVDNKAFEIIQSSDHNSFLVGVLKSGQLLPNEAAVVLSRTSDIIEDTFQINKPLSIENIRDLCSKEITDKLTLLRKSEFIPPASIELLNAIKNSESIIYGAGTPYSSLLPSLELKGVADSIKDAKCKKILVVNLSKETSNTLFVSDLLDNLIKYLSRSCIDSSKFNPQDFVTHIIVPDEMSTDVNFGNSIKLDEFEITRRYQWIKVIQADIRDSKNLSQHDGAKLKNCLIQTMSDD